MFPATFQATEFSYCEPNTHKVFEDKDAMISVLTISIGAEPSRRVNKAS
jgi:hypothetical protein